MGAARTDIIVVVEDDEGLAELIRTSLEEAGFAAESAFTACQAAERLAQGEAMLMLLDYSLPDMTGVELVKLLSATRTVPPFIVITGRDDAALAVEMMKHGAKDYLVKDALFLDRLPPAVARVLQEAETERRLREAETALRESEARLAKAQQISRMGSWELRLSSGAMAWSDGMYPILGISKGERLGPETIGSFLSFVHREDAALVRTTLDSHRETGIPFNIDFRVMTATGSEAVVNAQGELERGEDGKPLSITGTLLDITARKRAEDEIQQLAYYDTLTGLPNRTLLMDRLHQTAAQAHLDGHMAAVMFLDLDRFKGVNEIHGHEMGDRLLQAIADRLLRCVRECDTVARIGGDEFVVILAGVIHDEEITRGVEKILRTLSAPVQLDEHEIFTTGSIGISVYPADGEDLTVLLKNADLAMYQAKDGGRNNFQFFSSEMNIKVVERLMLENCLRRALERGELFLAYQPQMELKNGRVAGVEALLRWQHPDLGLLLPDRFIPLAEETGLIIPIGEWVLRAACEQGRRWHDAGHELRVAVNLSGLQFRQQDLIGMVANIVRETGFPPASLELELTESTIMSGAEEAIGVLRRLKEMGISLAIDDFGTGYSSLSYLKYFPIDRLKIDRSFVRDITVNGDDAAIAEAIIALARILKLKVTAEGVEMREQLVFLAERQCDEIQGIYLGTPVAADEVNRLLESEALTAARGRQKPLFV